MLAALGAGGAALLRARGPDPVLSELRWLLDRSNPPAGVFLRANELLVLAANRRDSGDLRLIAALLEDGSDRVVRNSLAVLCERLRACSTWYASDAFAAVSGVWSNWEKRQSDERLMALMPESFHCFAHGAYYDPGRPPETPGSPSRALRFLLVATLWGDAYTRSVADIGLPIFGLGDEIGLRLARLDGRGRAGAGRKLPADPRDWPVVSLVAWDDATIDALLRDPLPQVRWAMGRILTVCRDPRGVNAVSEWLSKGDGVPAGAAAAVAALLHAEAP